MQTDDTRGARICFYQSAGKGSAELRGDYGLPEAVRHGLDRVGFGTSPPLESEYVIDSIKGQIH
jgi:hypothetical protein